MVSDEIPLDEAPEHFFDQQKWSEFVDCFDNRQAAASTSKTYKIQKSRSAAKNK